MRKKHAGIILTTILAASIFAGCGSKASDKKEEVTITVFAAKYAQKRWKSPVGHGKGKAL